MGPKNNPYEDGFFAILIIFPSDYPNHGPEFRFKNKIYHLRVDPKNGRICIGSINSWRACGKVKGQSYNVKRALIDIFCFFMRIVLFHHMTMRWLSNSQIIPKNFMKKQKNGQNYTHHLSSFVGFILFLTSKNYLNFMFNNF